MYTYIYTHVIYIYIICGCAHVSEKYMYVQTYKQDDMHICMYIIRKINVYVCACLYTYMYLNVIFIVKYYIYIYIPGNPEVHEAYMT